MFARNEIFHRRYEADTEEFLFGKIAGRSEERLCVERKRFSGDFGTCPRAPTFSSCLPAMFRGKFNVNRNCCVSQIEPSVFPRRMKLGATLLEASASERGVLRGLIEFFGNIPSNCSTSVL